MVGHRCRAAESGHEIVVKLLLEKGAELETKDNRSRTPLSYAAYSEHEAVVKLLLEKGAELETKDNRGRTPLSWAAGSRNEIVVKLLLVKVNIDFNRRDKFGLTPLSFAAKKGYPDVVKFLLEKCKENDIVICEEEINISTPPVADYQSCILCDVCVSSIPDADIHYHFKICNDGDFDICQECIASGYLCLDHSHKLVKRMVKERAFVEVSD
jgi:hypothetical protein